MDQVTALTAEERHVNLDLDQLRQLVGLVEYDVTDVPRVPHGIGIWDFNKEPGLVCERPPTIILARSPASRRSIVAALIATSKAASPSVGSSSPSRRRIGT
jgi:hypothetical protein